MSTNTSASHTAPISAALELANQVLVNFSQNPSNIIAIDKAIQLFVESLKRGGKIMSCGNGGSMCDAMHFSEELTGRYRKDRPALAAFSLTEPAHISCVSNDFGYEHIFSRYVDALGKAEDCLLAISTSGNSKNVLMAVESAKSKGAKVVSLTGKDGGKLKSMSDVNINVETQWTDRIQEIHIKVIHIFIEGIERKLYPEHYT
ncbi:MAG: D-sedoheptulose 7-phosphate isomerase [Bacteriovoracaceae bacterium]|nr:D-sedoheptulose 7-phosphate isomerase [Bacteriovoracaceae bacterium]